MRVCVCVGCTELTCIPDLMPSMDIIIIIIMSLFKEDNIFSASPNLTYGPHKTWLNTYYLQTVKIYIYKIVQDTLKFDFKNIFK